MSNATHGILGRMPNVLIGGRQRYCEVVSGLKAGKRDLFSGRPWIVIPWTTLPLPRIEATYEATDWFSKKENNLLVLPHVRQSYPVRTKTKQDLVRGMGGCQSRLHGCPPRFSDVQQVDDRAVLYPCQIIPG